MNSCCDNTPPAAYYGPPRQQLDLSTLLWQFGSVPQRPWPSDPAAGIPTDLDQVAAWLDGTIPGTVQSDLVAVGRLPDPFWGDNVRACQWVERLDWWYRTLAPLRLAPGQRAFLEFDGIDTLSAICVDGHELGRHEGMFSRQQIEIPPEVARQSTAELAVRLWGSNALPRYATSAGERVWGQIAGLAQRSFRPFDDRLATLKAPMHSGWDFAPRLRTMGIWDDARLVVCEGVFIADVQVHAEPLTPLTDPTPARLTLRLTLDSDQPHPLAASIHVRPANSAGEDVERFDVVLNADGGLSYHAFCFELPPIRLWHPWERGDPCLYELTVTLCAAEDRLALSNSSPPLDTATVRFGARSVERHNTEGGYPWQYVVNGRPLFLRGANWAPIDALWGRSRRADYEPLLQQARQAGVNFLRVWGGGGREKRAFYDLCDELGLLVWQEFPIACVFLDHLPRSERFRRVLHAEATGIVRALRNHPSPFLWCGGNEFSPSRNREAVSVLKRAVADEDGARPFLAASPEPGDAHHWQVWHGLAPLSTYRDEPAACVSEFGLQAAPNVASLRRFLPESDLWPPGPAWQTHKADLTKLARYAQPFEEETTTAEAEADLESFVAATQAAQAAGLQIAVEHLRRRKGHTGGLAVWQWNDPWPAISWSIVDFFGEPKRAYETLRRVLQPVLISLEYPLQAHRPGQELRGLLWVVNDLADAFSDCRLLARLDGTVIHEQGCGVPANAAAAVGQMAVRLPASFRELRLELYHRNEMLATNVYDLRFHDSGRQRIDRKARRRLVDRLLK